MASASAVASDMWDSVMAIRPIHSILPVCSRRSRRYKKNGLTASRKLGFVLDRELCLKLLLVRLLLWWQHHHGQVEFCLVGGG